MKIRIELKTLLAGFLVGVALTLILGAAGRERYDMPVIVPIESGGTAIVKFEGGKEYYVVDGETGKAFKIFYEGRPSGRLK